MSESDDTLEVNRRCWNRVAPEFYGRTALPAYGPLAPTEDTLALLDCVAGARVLEVGCGSGHSLRYLAERGAAELWGIDLSGVQIGFATEVLQPFRERARLFETPMEKNPGLPTDYFDLVFSVYGLGWTVDLPGTLRLVRNYLKPGGCFVCSGEHPAYGCLTCVEGKYVLSQSYWNEGPVFLESWNGAPVVIQRRRLSTFVNEIVAAGLRLEKLIETEVATGPGEEAVTDPARWYSIPRAQMMPTTFIAKARRPEA